MEAPWPSLVKSDRDESCIGSKWSCHPRGGTTLSAVALFPPGSLRQRPQVGFPQRMSLLKLSLARPNPAEVGFIQSSQTTSLFLTPLPLQLVLVGAHLLRVLFMWLVIRNSLPSHLPLYTIVLPANMETLMQSVLRYSMELTVLERIKKTNIPDAETCLRRKQLKAPQRSWILSVMSLKEATAKLYS